MTSPVRVAIVGVGNCASALVQGVHKYRDAAADAFVPGLMHVDLGGYHVRDIQFVAAFDVDTRKVGHDLAEAIFAEPNNTVRFAEVAPTGVTVSRGRTLDGIGQYLAEVVDESPCPQVDVAAVLRETQADVLVNYLPVGSEQATRWYMDQALAAHSRGVHRRRRAGAAIRDDTQPRSGPGRRLSPAFPKHKYSVS